MTTRISAPCSLPVALPIPLPIRLFAIALLLASSPTLRAQDEEADAPLLSGPPVGTETSPVMAYAPVGDHAGEEFDVVSGFGDGPGALLFVHELSRNALPVIRAIDQAGTEFSLLGLHTASLMLSDDRTETEGKLKAINGSLKLKKAIVLSLDGADGPGNYALNRKAVLTLVIVNQGKVVRSAGFTDVNQKDAATVREWISEVTGPLPDDPNKLRELAEATLPESNGELRSLAAEQALELHRLHAEVAALKQRLADAAYGSRTGGMPTRGDGAPTRESMSRGETPEAGKPPAATADGNSGDAKPERQGAPPTDAELSGLLRSLIRQSNDDATNDTTFATIQERAKTSDDLHAQTVQMFKLMLSYRDRYGSDYAQGLAETFLGTAEAKVEKKAKAPDKEKE